MQVIVHGAGGRMGRALCALLLSSSEDRLAAGILHGGRVRGTEEIFPAFCLLEDCREAADVIVDFSSPSATSALLSYAVGRHLPLVVGTTGQAPAEKRAIRRAAGEIPICLSPNFSRGTAVFRRAVSGVATAWKTADAEILEAHRRDKRDAPSGTALALSALLSPLLSAREGIPVHSLRLGNETGTHAVVFALGGERITVTHAVTDRTAFAEGALAAARLLCGMPPGLYTAAQLWDARQKPTKGTGT